MKKFFLVLIIAFCCMGITLFNFGEGSRVVVNGNRYLVSVDGVKAEKIPSNGDYYLSSYECNNKNTIVSWNRDRYELSVSNGTKKGGVSCYLEFDSNPRLSDMKKGSYVSYSGDFSYDGGWRIAYSKDGIAYLISDGIVSNMCTNLDGSIGEYCSGVLDSSLASRHIDNLNSVASRYCNNSYVYDGNCNLDVVRNISGIDFSMMLSKQADLGTCYDVQSKKCGYVNDLIDIDDNYWYSDFYSSSSSDFLYWSSEKRAVSNGGNNYSYGVRPIIKMDSNVIVVGGEGTKDNPYKIRNQSFLIKNVDLKKNIISLSMLGYGVDSMCINFNSAVCTSYVPFFEEYNLNVSDIKDNNIIYVYYKNKDGNIIASVHKKLLVE